ncbi:MAG: DUF1015 domain-containing protein [Gemmataceae bacterium]|nr:DUF1015 domain-containing protein [Gemmataceae bacterium]
MAEIQAFRGFRYDLGRVGPLSGVIAPPYDVIDSALRERLAGLHACNIVHVDLPVGGEDRYERAGRMWKDWTRSGMIQQDSARSIYVYEQSFSVDGESFVRRGILARVHIESWSTGKILAHEDTFAGPKQDRLRLMEATAANLSPVFGLFDDDNGEVQRLIESAILRKPPVEGTDILGVTGRLWAISDQSVIAKLAGLVGPREILIADGHHRYETCLHFRDQHVGADAAADDPRRFTLMMLVPTSDPGLLVLPTHRLFQGLPGINLETVRSLLGESFELVGVAATRDAYDRLTLELGQGALAFGTGTNTWLVGRLRNPEVMAGVAADHSAAWRGLSVSVLHRLVVDRILSPKATGSLTTNYVHSLAEVDSALTRHECDLAVLVHPVSVDETATLARGGERMPQKSTYFYPKLQTGFVFNPLDSH